MIKLRMTKFAIALDGPARFVESKSSRRRMRDWTFNTTWSGDYRESRFKRDSSVSVDGLIPGSVCWIAHLSEVVSSQSRNRRWVGSDPTESTIPQFHAAEESLKLLLHSRREGLNYYTQALSGHLETQAEETTCGGKRPQSRVGQRKGKGVTKSKTQADPDLHSCFPSAERTSVEDAWTVDAKPLI
jgi:hypothetical protein